MNLSGGWCWHCRAWLSQKLWQQTCDQIASCLDDVEPTSPELLLIGASAGWMMPSSWLQKFSKVTTYDIDPLAAPLFRWRHAAALKACGCELSCHTSNALTHLNQLTSAHPSACVFFDNILGQYRFHCDCPTVASQQIHRIVKSLHGREWGALHEVYSGPVTRVRDGRELPSMRRRVQGSPDSDAFAQTWLSQLGAKGEWLDHLTSDVFGNGTVVSHIAWPFKPDYCHWLQVGWVSPSRRTSGAC